MEILNGNAGVLTNYEVRRLLESEAQQRYDHANFKTDQSIYLEFLNFVL